MTDIKRLSFEEILEIFKQNDINTEIFAEESEVLKDIAGLGDVIEVEDESDYMGDMTLVRHFKDHDVFIKVRGRYSSYDGSTWRKDFYEVTPVEKTVIAFEHVKK